MACHRRARAHTRTFEGRGPLAPRRVVCGSHDARASLVCGRHWGAECGAFDLLKQWRLTRESVDPARLRERTFDQQFLRDQVWPLMKSRGVLVHSDWCTGYENHSRPFPSPQTLKEGWVGMPHLPEAIRGSKGTLDHAAGTATGLITAHTRSVASVQNSRQRFEDMFTGRDRRFSYRARDLHCSRHEPHPRCLSESQCRTDCVWCGLPPRRFYYCYCYSTALDTADLPADKITCCIRDPPPSPCLLRICSLSGGHVALRAVSSRRLLYYIPLCIKASQREARGTRRQRGKKWMLIREMDHKGKG
jgi:hypothetical protein